MAWCNVGRPTTSERATYGVMWVDQSVTTGVDLVVRSREVDQCTPYSQHNNIHSLYCLQTYVTIAVKIVFTDVFIRHNTIQYKAKYNKCSNEN